MIEETVKKGDNLSQSIVLACKDQKKRALVRRFFYDAARFVLKDSRPYLSGEYNHTSNRDGAFLL